MAHSRSGLLWGALGVLAFSFTVPFTRIAVGGLDPVLTGSGRVAVAGVLAVALLGVTRQPLPARRLWPRIAVVAAGVAAGFPLLTAFALQTAPAAHGAIVVGLLPAATAVVAVIRARERPPLVFWIAAALGAVAAVGFASLGGDGAVASVGPADLLLLLAVLAAAVAYAEGALLARELGAWQTICWALVLATPFQLAAAGVSVAAHPPTAGPAEWLAFGYLAVVSQLLGFFPWYRGLAIGPIARVGQVQLVQPVLSIAWAALLLGEAITVAIVLGGLVVIACAAVAVTVRRRGKPPPSTTDSRVA